MSPAGMRSPRGILASLVACTVVSALVPIMAAPARAQTYTLGVDVSHHQNAIDWNKVADSGHVFAFHKATEGATFTDNMYATNRSGTASFGIPFGAYHFARPQGGSIAAAQQDAVDEATYFLEVAQPAPGDLVPVLDMEANRDGLPAGRLIAWTQAWLDTIEGALDVEPLIYTSPNFWSSQLNDTTTFAQQGFPLWIAHYTSAAAPRVPASNWNGAGWSFWQWTSCATIPGISGCADEDRFPGTDLSPFTIPGGIEPQPTPGPAIPPSNESPPTISGAPEVGETLTAERGTWSGTEPISYSYAWYRCAEDGSSCSGILHQSTEPTYNLESADFGFRMKVTVTATNSGGSDEASSASTGVVSDTTAPARPRMTQPRAPRTLADVIDVSWSEPEQGATYDVRYRSAPKSGRFGASILLLEGSSQTSTTLEATPGSTYCFSARAIDTANNVSGWSSQACTNAPLDDRDLRAGPGWKKRTPGDFYRGTVTKTSRRGAKLTVRNVRARDIHVVAQKCPSCGRVAVLFNGKRVANLNLRSRRTLDRRVIRAAGFGSIRRGTVRLVVLSRGAPVKIDGLALTIRS
ncbi:MAG: glycoside hydrolase family 25 protein [Actinomycetota bacterium]|nr:glycoside hydrolase family 25 protein [Actinomycetota bacterium]